MLRPHFAKRNVVFNETLKFLAGGAQYDAECRQRRNIDPEPEQRGPVACGFLPPILAQHAEAKTGVDEQHRSA